MTTGKRGKKPDVLAGKRDPLSRLYRGVRDYVEANGGSVVAIGGVVVIEWRGDLPEKFTIAVKCTGSKPGFAEVKP